MRRTLFEDDHLAFGESVRGFVERDVRPRHESIIEQRFIDRGLWKTAGALGFLGLGVPEKFGGSDAGDYRFNAILIEELARVSAAFPSAFGIQIDVVAPYLVTVATDDQKRRWLPGLCSGDLITAIAMTEPGAGSDLAGVRTVAHQKGDDWIINGSKTFITNGHQADLVVVAVKTAPDKGARGLTLFVVEAGMSGFERGRKLDKVGQPESDTAELFFHDVRVPAENVLGEVNGGFQLMMTMLPHERISAAVSNIAHARTIYAETLDYAKERKAFGQPVGTFQANKFTLAELATQLEITQSYIDAAVIAFNSAELSPVDAAKAKWWTAEIQNRVIDSCLQIYGGYGYMNEYAVARAWKDARVTRIWAGSNEIMKEIIGRDLGL